MHENLNTQEGDDNNVLKGIKSTSAQEQAGCRYFYTRASVKLPTRFVPK